LAARNGRSSGVHDPEAKATIDSIKGKGYTVLATMLAGGTVATVPNLEGQTIWLNNDPLPK
jgi:hypothetical protein